jgi:hypothetical protein
MEALHSIFRNRAATRLVGLLRVLYRLEFYTQLMHSETVLKVALKHSNKD